MRRAFRWLIVGVVLAGLAVLGSATGALGRWLGPDRAYSRDHQRLLEAIGPVRPIPARLSGGSPYRPYRRLRSASQSRSFPSSTRSGAKETELSSGISVPREITKAIQRSGEGKSTPEGRAALATLELLDGDMDKAIRLLRKAHEQAPDDPRILNDLAAALLTVYETTGDPWSAVEALEIALRAERLELTLPALFNKALALEKLRARTRAIVAWNSYLDQDSSSPWAQEARQRRDRLAQGARGVTKLLAAPAADVTAFEGNLWANRQLAERTLLPRWGEHTLAGRFPQAEAALAQAEALAEGLTPDSGRLLTASTSEIRETQRARDQQRLDLLARGHHAFGQAFLLRRAEQTSKAREILEGAIRDLHAAGSPFELRARLLRAWMAEPPDWSELRTLQRAAFPTVAAEARRIAAYWMTLEGRLESSVRAYQDAHRRFQTLREREEATVVSIMIANLLGMLSREQETSRILDFALDAGPWVADPWSRYSIYVVATGTVDDRFPRAAVELRLEAADACRDLPERPLCAVDSSLRVAAITPDAEVAEEALPEC